MNRQQRHVGAKFARAPGVPVGDAVADRLQTGLALHQAGRLVEAEACYQRVLAVEPENPDALHLIGNIAYQVGRHDAAIAMIGQAIRRNGRNPLYFSNLGLALGSQGRFDEALTRFEQALVLKPDYAEAHHNRANVLTALNRHVEALASYDRALAVLPGFVQAHFNRANLLAALGRFEDALAGYDRVLALKADHPEAHNNRGNALRALRRLEAALASYHRAVALKADYAQAFNNRGVVLYELKRFDAAVADFDVALALMPDGAVFCNRGNALQALARFDEALASYDQAVALKPDHAEAFYNRGNVLKELRRIDEALASYEKALALRPDYVDANWNEAYLRLLTGDFERGLTRSEWRWNNPASGLQRRHLTRPLWLGGAAIDGKTILLHSDQGMGDVIFFCRYVPLLAARGARVIVEVEEPLRALMSGLAGVAQCISKTETAPDFDLHCPMSSLPLACETRLETIPGTTPYLRLPEHTADWEARLPAHDRPRIGLAWSGNARHSNDHNRSIALSALAPLFDLPAHFISLQTEVRPDDAATLRAQSRVLDLGSTLGNFADTAALIARLDLVVSVDTSVAHLSGALGMPVWVLLPFSPDWRWLLDRQDSPWYPTARLFRQSKSREWNAVVGQLRDALDDFVASKQHSVMAGL
jgi:tetratricopeptide (TPR) repeat protein